MPIHHLKQYAAQSTSIWPLVTMRVGFGLLMMISIIRFWNKGWISELYIDPKFHFTYHGLEWIQPLGSWTYLLFFICGLSALFVALGWKYKASIVLFFLSFTYIELMDKTTYLNHYYFISCLSFLFIFLPANGIFSLDAYFKKTQIKSIPLWMIHAIMLMVGIVYFYAGLAKLNTDWLFSAMPLKIWLTSKYDLPVLGELFQNSWVHYGMSWAGALFDLSIVFLLINNKTRLFGFVMVVIFHVLTGWLFPIGMFPYIMIVVVLIFFKSQSHEKFWIKIQSLWNSWTRLKCNEELKTVVLRNQTWKLYVLMIFLGFQVLIPWRYLLHSGELFWNEKGYRFSWRVMLVEKKGYTLFKVVDRSTGKSFVIDNAQYLTDFQIKQMSFQPDFILEFAHYLEEVYKNKGFEDVEIFAESYVALNGRRSRKFVDETVDLTRIKKSSNYNHWITELEDEIKGF